MTKKISGAIIFALFIAHSITLAQGYNININIIGYPDSVVYLGNYYGDRLSLADTAQADDGHIRFAADEALKQGVYFVVSYEKKKLFEFIVDDDQEFSLTTPMNAPPDQMSVEGSAENELFYNYLTANKRSFEQMKTLQSRIKGLEKGNDSIAILSAQIDSINKASIEYKLRLMEENPSTLTALLFKLMREPEVPDFFRDDGRHDTLSAYLYYRNHYWDGIDFSDDRILRTPVFSRKLETYMEQVIPKHPDSVITEIDRMIAATNENTDMKEYLLWHFTNTYETSKVMGYDRIFVHMVDKYFTDVTYEWLHPEVQKNMINRVNTLRNVLIDTYAPPLIMADTAGHFIAMRQISADYLIIFFWTTTCGECKREVDALKAFHNESPLDIKIFAVNTDTSMTEWKQYINKKELDWIHVNGNISLTGDYHDAYDIYSTPVIYVLDDKKKIIAKRLAASRIPEFIERHRKLKYEKE